MARDLEDRLDEFPKGWRPKPGDKLVGVVTGIDVRDGDYGRYPVVTVETEDGEIAVHAFHTVLKRELARQRPRPGERIGIAYHGRDEGKGYERYRLAVDREAEPDAGPDWDEIGEQAERELSGDDPSAGDDDDDPFAGEEFDPEPRP